MAIKTRRKSKAAAAVAAEAEADAEMAESSQATNNADVPSTITVALPDDFDYDLFANLIPDVEDWANPSSETILRVYFALVAQTKDYDSAQEAVERLQGDLEKKDVELDQALQDRETTSRELETALEETRGELEQARKERDELGMASLRH
jgi:nucleoprotein TPR